MVEKLKADFLKPLDEYTPIPFWFWNDDLSETEIKRQIHDFNDKGVKGFVLHPRIGIPKEIEYLSDRFLEYVAYAVAEADKLGMKVVLYDEAMYPSGSAHGMVVKKHPDYASKALSIKEYQCTGKFRITLDEAEVGNIVSVQAVKKVSDQVIIPESLCTIPVINNEINFEADDTGDWWLLVFVQTYTGGHIRGIHFGEDDGEAASPASTDLLKEEAIQEFINLTHQRYYEVLHKYFGKTIIGMFTDEPCIMGRGNMEGLRPWTDNFLAYYLEQGNKETDLPYLWFQAGEATEIKRRSYEETVNKRMEESYYKPIYEWCEEHNIALTGHPEKSDDIDFLKYFHMPAQDLVWRWVAPEENLALEGQNSTMAKCSSDSARHRGRRRNGNECFACCGKDRVEWAFSADDMKWYMDWLFVRGVNLLFPHAFFYSIDGSRRIGERPPDVGPNNIWWPYYNQISDYIKRMSYLMTDSVNQARVAVLCGAYDLPWKIVKPLYENQIEFNYLENELFQSEECVLNGASLTIANQEYKVVLIEDINLIDIINLPKLEQFIVQGGSVIIYNPDNKDLGINHAKNINSFLDLVDLVSQNLLRDVIPSEELSDLRVSHMIKNGFDFYVLVNEGEIEINSTLRLKAKGSIEIWDAWHGVVKEAEHQRKIDDNYMEIDLPIKRRESIILFINTNVEVKEVVKETGKEEYKDTRFSSSALIERINLDNDWYMGTDLQKLNKVNELILWNELSGMEHYSGSMLYRNSFCMKQCLNNIKAELNLGEIYEIAQVTLNGKDVGIQLWAPYTFDVTDYLKEGRNDLVIEVKNTLANRIGSLSLSSGLLGPVYLSFLDQTYCII